MEYPDYYQTLGISRDASTEEIRKAYRKLAMKSHPDRFPEDQRDEAEKTFRQVSEAYEVLSDPEKRKKYDTLGKDWRRAEAHAGAQPPPGGPQAWDTADRAHHRTMTPEEFEEIFGGRGFSDFFTSFFGEDMADRFGRQRQRHTRFRQQGSDVRATVKAPIRLAMSGGRSSFNIDAQIVCPTCGGTGMLGESDICPACGGVGRQHRRKTVTVKIPPNVRDGQTLRLKGLGEAGVQGAPPGDLYLTIQIAGDHVYEVHGSDIYADVPIAPWEAALGAKITVRTVSGEVLLTIPPDTRSGAKLRIRGQGLPRADDGRGDFYARVRIDLPKELRPEDREQLKRWKESSPPPVVGGARSGGGSS